MIGLLSTPFKKKGTKISPVASPSSVMDFDECDNIINELDNEAFSSLPHTLPQPFPLTLSIRNPRNSFLQLDSHFLTFELAALENCESHFEAIAHLRRINDWLSQLSYPDRIFYCKSTFESTVHSLHHRGVFWFKETIPQIKAILLRFFTSSCFDILPTFVLQEIFHYLSFDEFSTVPTVCKLWKETSYEDVVWKTFYHRKFLLNNPASLPAPSKRPFRLLFKLRLHDPMVGDKVEVAWKGKFRLESSDVYEGLAWWVAEVVDTHSSQGE